MTILQDISAGFKTVGKAAERLQDIKAGKFTGEGITLTPEQAIEQDPILSRGFYLKQQSKNMNIVQPQFSPQVASLLEEYMENERPGFRPSYMGLERTWDRLPFDDKMKVASAAGQVPGRKGAPELGLAPAEEGQFDYASYRSPIYTEEIGKLIEEKYDIKGADWWNYFVNPGEAYKQNFMQEAQKKAIYNSLPPKLKAEISEAGTPFEFDKDWYMQDVERGLDRSFYEVRLAPKTAELMTTEELKAELRNLEQINKARVPILEHIPILNALPNFITDRIEAHRVWKDGTPERAVYDRKLLETVYPSLVEGMTIGVSKQLGYKAADPKYLQEQAALEAARPIGLVGGGLVGYSQLAKLIRPQLLKDATLAAIAGKHPLLFNTIIQNTGEEFAEIGIRKGTGQGYTAYDFVAGIILGSVFELAHFGKGKLKGLVSGDEWKGMLPALQNQLEAKLRLETARKGMPLNEGEFITMMSDIPVKGKYSLGDMFFENRYAFKDAIGKIEPEARPPEKLRTEAEIKEVSDYFEEMVGLQYKELDRLDSGKIKKKDMQGMTKEEYRDWTQTNIEDMEGKLEVLREEPRLGAMDWIQTAENLKKMGDEYKPLAKEIETSLKEGTIDAKTEYFNEMLDTYNARPKLAEFKAESRKGGEPLDPEVVKRLEEKKAIIEEQKQTIDQFEAEAKQGKRNFRSDKFNITEAQQAELTKLYNAMGLDTYIVRTFADMQQFALELGIKPSQAFDLLNVNRLDSEIVAMQSKINITNKFILNAETKLKQGLLKEAEGLDLRNRLDGAKAELDGYIKQLTLGKTEIARGMVAMRMMAQETLDPAYWMTKALKRLAVNKLPDTVKGNIRDYIANSDASGLAQYVYALGDSTWTEQMITLWKAGLLTSPTTHVTNMLSTTGMTSLEIVKDYPAVAMDWMIGKVTGERFVFRPDLKKTFGEGVRTGAKDMVDNILGKTESDIYKWDEYKKTNYDNIPIVGGFLNKYTQTIFNFLSGEDKLFKGIIRTKSRANAARSKAYNEGFRGNELETKTAEYFENPTPEIDAIAELDARIASFQNQNFLSEMMRGGKKYGRTALPGSEIGLDFIAPFIRTPTNVGLATIDYSPIGLLKTIAQQLNPKTAGQKAFVENFARNVTGTGIMALGYYLASEGKMTGAYPESETERALWEMEGKTDSGIRIGDYWYNLDRVSPTGNTLSMGADAWNSREMGFWEQTQVVGFQSLNNLTEQSFLLGLSRGLGAITAPEQKGAAFLEGIATGFVPSIVRRTTRITDPYVRDADTLEEKFLKAIPGLSHLLPKQRQRTGKPIMREGGVVQRAAEAFLDIFNRRRAADTGLTQEMRRLWEYSYNATPSKIPDRLTVDGITFKLTGDDKDLVGDQKYDILWPAQGRYIETQAYKKLSNYDKKRTLQNMEDKVWESIKGNFLVQAIPLHPELAILKDVVDYARLSDEDKVKLKNASNEKMREVYRRVDLSFHKSNQVFYRKLLENEVLTKDQYKYLKENVTFAY